MRKITIQIEVIYDDSFPVPFDIKDDLRTNVTRCIEAEGLLNDPQQISVVKDWNVQLDPLPKSEVDDSWTPKNYGCGICGRLECRGNCFK